MTENTDYTNDGSIWNRMAQVWSVICYPLLIPTYGMLAFCIAFSKTQIPLPTSFWLYTVLGTFLLTCAIPVVLILLMIRRGEVKDIYITNPKERVIPYIYTILSFAIWCSYVHVIHMPLFIQVAAIGATGALFIVTIVNMWWKISAHLCAMGGLIGGVMGFCYFYGVYSLWTMVILLTISLLLMCARLRVCAHDEWQVIAGFILGLSATFIPNLCI